MPPWKDDVGETSYHIFPLRIRKNNEKLRDIIIDNAAKSHISLNVHFIPLPELKIFKSLGYDLNDYPIAKSNYINEISLPIYPQLSNKDIIKVCSSVNESIENYK